MAIKRKKINKKSKQKINPTVKTTTSGCDMLDLALGGGAGWGKVLNIVGDKSSGKTLLVCELLAAAKRKYGDKLSWFWDDAERGFSFDSKKIWNLNVLPENTEQYSETVEQWTYNVKSMLEEHINQKDKYFIYVTDSLDALSSIEELEYVEDRHKAMANGAKQKGSYKMGKAKLLSEFFRVITGDIQSSNCLLVVISQVRTNINAGPFGKKTTRSGGKALDFYAMHVVELTVIKKIEEEYKGAKRKTGVVVKAHVAKNKLWKPYRDCVFTILFDYGVDNIDSNLCFLFDLITPEGRLKKKIPNINWDGRKFTSRKKLIQYIEENNQEDDLKFLCIDKWNQIEKAFEPTERKPRWI